MEMKITRKVVAALAIAGALSMSAIGIAHAVSNDNVQPADHPAGPVSGTIDRAPTPGYDEIVLGE